MNCNRTLCRLSAGLLSHLMVVILSNLSMRPLCAMHLSNVCWQIQVHSDPLQPSIDLPLFCRETRGRTALNMSSYCVIDSRLYGSVLLSQRTSSRGRPSFSVTFHRIVFATPHSGIALSKEIDGAYVGLGREK